MILQIIFTLPKIVLGLCTPEDGKKIGPRWVKNNSRFPDIYKAVDACLAETENGSCPIFSSASNGNGCGNGGVNGKIGEWDVSKITDMDNLFYVNISSIFRKAQFNADIGKWNVAKVTNSISSK